MMVENVKTQNCELINVTEREQNNQKQDFLTKMLPNGNGKYFIKHPEIGEI